MFQRVLNDRMRVRNLSIIAHVDHGKTSLSDCLLQHAGQLSLKRRGALELDNLVEEKQRGITIQCSAVALLFDDVPLAALDDARRRALERVALLAPAAHDALELFVDGLPRAATEAHVRDALGAAVGALVTTLHVRSHRGSARLVLKPGAEAAAAAATLCADGLLVAGAPRAARVERANAHGGVMRRVAQRAHALGVPMPTFDAPVGGEGRREARHAAARAWLAAHGAADAIADDAALLPPLLTDSDGVLLNLIDSPGHVDFSSEVTTALRMTDGGLVVVDAVDGPATQTESVLRQAIAEGVTVVLFLNKVDKALTLLDADALYDALELSIDKVNSTLAGSQKPLSFAAGTVALGSALEGWAVSIDSALRLYAARASSPGQLAKLRKRLATKRGFVELVLGPVLAMRATLLERGDAAGALEKLVKIGCAPTGRVLEHWRSLEDSGDHTALLRLALSQMMPLAPVVSAMVVTHLPSPIEGQLRRADRLYSVETEDDSGDSDGSDDSGASAAEAQQRAIFESIRRADARAGAIAFCAKRVEFGGRSFTLARVMAGTLAIGAEMRQLVDDEPTTSAKITSLAVIAGAGRDVQRVESAPAGAIVLIGGLSIAHGTVTNVDGAHALTKAHKLVSHVMGVALRIAPSCKKSNAEKRFVDGLRKLTSADPSLRVTHNDSNETLLLGAGELHLEVSVSRLERESDLTLIKSTPIVSLRETLVAASARTMMGKSSNKHNRIFAIAEPLDELWREALAESSDAARRAALRSAGVSLSDVKNVVCFGRYDNVVVDGTSGISLSPIADSLREAFEQLERDGVLARGQQLTGVRFVVVDVKYHNDANHRAPAQVVPAAARAFRAALLGAPMRIVEPLLRVDVTVKSDTMNDAYGVLHKRGANCDAATMSEHNDFVRISALIGVRDSLGLAEDLRRATKGRAFPALAPSGWRVIDHDVRSERVALVVNEARERHGLSAGIPEPDDDRL